MKKIIRFILAAGFTPIALSWMFLDWIYDSDTSSISNWKKHITFN